jgi:hypothetical protein
MRRPFAFQIRNDGGDMIDAYHQRALRAGNGTGRSIDMVMVMDMERRSCGC